MPPELMLDVQAKLWSPGVTDTFFGCCFTTTRTGHYLPVSSYIKAGSGASGTQGPKVLRYAPQETTSTEWSRRTGSIGSDGVLYATVGCIRTKPRPSGMYETMPVKHCIIVPCGDTSNTLLSELCSRK